MRTVSIYIGSMTVTVYYSLVAAKKAPCFYCDGASGVAVELYIHSMTERMFALRRDEVLWQLAAQKSALRFELESRPVCNRDLCRHEHEDARTATFAA